MKCSGGLSAQIGIGEDGGEDTSSREVRPASSSSTCALAQTLSTSTWATHQWIGGYAQFTQGEFLVDGTVRALAFELLGGGTILPGGQLIAANSRL